MKQISFYQTIEDLADKTFCQLIEKCYSSNLKVVIFTADIQMQEYYDRLLWIYSPKKFIPHGTKYDDFPELQPIYITPELENPNQASILVMIKQTPTIILNLLLPKQDNPISSVESLNFERAIIVYNGSESSNFNKLINEIRTLKNSNFSIDYFKQEINGGWVKEN